MSIRELATQTGVSITTVSRVFMLFDGEHARRVVQLLGEFELSQPSAAKAKAAIALMSAVNRFAQMNDAM